MSKRSEATFAEEVLSSWFGSTDRGTEPEGAMAARSPNWNDTTAKQPRKGALVAVRNIHSPGDVRVGRYDGGYIVGKSLPDGYLMLASYDEWVELPE
jgi:hypothetical protein